MTKRPWIPEAIRYSEDPTSGVVVEQLTSQPVTSTNIYCEQRYASADGQRIAISRKPFGQPKEIWACDMRSYRLTYLVTGTPCGANALRNAIYFLIKEEGRALMKSVDLATFEVRELYEFPDGELPTGGGAISPDEKYFVTGPYHLRDDIYSLRAMDLSTGEYRTLCEIEDMINPHLQFEPTQGRMLNVQINRGAKTNPKTGERSLAGEMGATLCAVDVETGKVTDLPIGRPHTPPISGHECWIGASGQILFTAAQYQVSKSAFVTIGTPPPEEADMPPVAIYAVAPGDEVSRVVSSEYMWNHLAASDDGQYFIADDHATGRIYVGSIATGEARYLCESGTRQGVCQYSHVHPYMTPDNGHVIFNSIVTGVGQVYAAQIPDGFLAGL